MRISVVLDSCLHYPLIVKRALQEVCSGRFDLVFDAPLSCLAAGAVVLMVRRDIVLRDPVFLGWVRSRAAYVPYGNDPKNPDLIVYRGRSSRMSTMAIDYERFGIPRTVLGLAGLRR